MLDSGVCKTMSCDKNLFKHNKEASSYEVKTKTVYFSCLKVQFSSPESMMEAFLSSVVENETSHNFCRRIWRCILCNSAMDFFWVVTLPQVHDAQWKVFFFLIILIILIGNRSSFSKQLGINCTCEQFKLFLISTRGCCSHLCKLLKSLIELFLKQTNFLYKYRLIALCMILRDSSLLSSTFLFWPRHRTWYSGPCSAICFKIFSRWWDWYQLWKTFVHSLFWGAGRILTMFIHSDGVKLLYCFVWNY